MQKDVNHPRNETRRRSGRQGQKVLPCSRKRETKAGAGKVRKWRGRDMQQRERKEQGSGREIVDHTSAGKKKPATVGRVASS